MKKFLLTAALVLALVVSLTAGTMAFYSADVDTIKSTVQTKDFSFTADETSSSFQTGVEIAPGDSLTYKVTVKNISEVYTDATFTASLAKGFASSVAGKDGITVSIVRETKDGEIKTISKDSEASGATTAQVRALMGLDSVDVYTVTVNWDKGEAFGAALSKKLQDKPIILTIAINGQQHLGEGYNIDTEMNIAKTGS